MNRIVVAIGLFLLATPALALERSPNDRGGRDGGGGHQSASSERGERLFGGDRDRSVFGGQRSSLSRPQREHSGRSGDRN